MKKSRTIIFAFLFIGAFMISCGTREAPSPVATTSKEVSPAQEKPAREGWEGEWEKVIAEARKEGKVSAFVGAGGEIREAMIKGFRGKYGIDIDVSSIRSQEFAARIKAERKAGIYTFDVYQSGTGTALLDLKPDGILEPLEPALILPEVTNPKSWWKGELHFADKDRLALNFLGYPSTPIAINTDFVKLDEVRSYNDLLNSKWKEKMTLLDPTLPGAGGNLVGIVGDQLMGYEFLRKLAQQRPIVLRDARLQLDWLVSGKYPIAISPDTTPLIEFQKVGFTNIVAIVPAEGTYITAGFGAVALINKATHPNAAKVYINWLLSKEGQLVYTRVALVHSGRVDLPTDFLPSYRVRDPKAKYADQTREEYILKQPEYFKIAREIFGPLMR